MSASGKEPRGSSGGGAYRRLLAGALLSTALLAGLGLWVLAQPAPARPADSVSHASTRQQVKPYMSPSQLPSSQQVSFPAYVNTPTLREAYQFAIDRPDVLMYLPCYCGCGLEAGHRSNLDCFVKGVSEQEGMIFDDHGSGCQTCVDIALDAKGLVAQGKSLPEVRKAIDQAHGEKGPGTDTPLPPA